MCVEGESVSSTVYCCIVCNRWKRLPARVMKAQSTDISKKNRWLDAIGQILAKDGVERALTASRFQAFFRLHRDFSVLSTLDSS
jgi:hypothetical protein